MLESYYLFQTVSGLNEEPVFVRVYSHLIPDEMYEFRLVDREGENLASRNFSIEMVANFLQNLDDMVQWVQQVTDKEYYIHDYYPIKPDASETDDDIPF